MAESIPSNQQTAEAKRSVVLTNYRDQQIELDPSIVVDFSIH